jgi:hypothetical protein
MTEKSLEELKKEYADLKKSREVDAEKEKMLKLIIEEKNKKKPLHKLVNGVTDFIKNI